MKDRKNHREKNLAAVSEEKAIEDSTQLGGLFGFDYFDTKLRKEHRVSVNQEGRWIYESSAKPVPNQRFMYAVGKRGALYIGNPTVHSQFKAGKETQSAGGLDYKWNENKSELTIDNCSGHYTPTLSQFLSTLHGLHETGMIPDKFNIKLSRLTRVDIESDTNHFWEEAVKNSILPDTTNIITVAFSPTTNGFIFYKENGDSCELSAQAINQNTENYNR